MEQLLSDIKKKIEEQQNATRDFNSALAMHVKQGITESVVPTMDRIVLALDVLTSVTERLRTEKEESTGVLVDTIVTNFKSALVDHTSAELGQLKDAMSATAEQQIKTRDGLEMVSSAFAKLSEEIHSTTKDFVQELRGVVTEMITDNRSWSNDFKEQFSADLTKQSSFNKDLQGNIESSISKSLSSLESAFEDHLTKVNDRMDFIMSKVSKWADESSKELGSYAGALASQSASIVGAGEAIKAASNDLDSMFKEQKAFLENLSEAIETFKKVASTVSSSADRVASLQDVSQEGIKTLTAEINRNASMFKDGEVLLKTQKEVYEALDGGISRSLNAINEATRQYSEHTRESLGTYLSDFDKHLSDAVGQLNSTVRDLEGAMGEVADSVRNSMGQLKPEIVGGNQINIQSEVDTPDKIDNSAASVESNLELV
jgi:hypothetical protein